MDLYFAGLGFVDSNIYIYQDHKNRLLSYTNEKTYINKFTKLLKGENDMKLFLAGVMPSPKPKFYDIFNLGYARLFSYFHQQKELEIILKGENDMKLFLAGDCSGFPKCCPYELGLKNNPHLISYEHPKGKESIDNYIKARKEEEKDMDLYLVGPEKECIMKEVVDNDKSKMLITFDTKALIDKHKERFKEEDKKMDLYLAGSEALGNKRQANLVEDNDCLLSFNRKEDTNRSINNLEKKGSKLFIDSGAFTAWTKGKEINVDEYIKFINDRSEYIYLYGQVDSIPGSRVGSVITQEMVREAAQKTWENYLYMRPKMKNPDGLLYTFHVGEPFEYLKQALEWTDQEGKHIPYIALGGMVGKNKETRKSFLEKCFKIIKTSSNPNVKIHAFGMTDFDLLAEYPITSADSTSWIMTGATGMIMTSFGNIIVSDKQKGDPSHYSHLSPEALKVVNEEIKEFGFCLDDLKDSRDNRIILNARFMNKRAAQLVQKEFKVKKRLF